MATNKIVNCSNCGQITEQSSDYAFSSFSSFCCSGCKKAYYSTRPIRRKFRKTVNAVAGIFVAGSFASLFLQKSADVNLKNDSPPVLEEQQLKDSNKKRQAEEIKKHPAKGAVKSSD
jgi:hypothetical protein